MNTDQISDVDLCLSVKICRCGFSVHLASCLFSSRGADCRLNVLDFLWRRQHSLHSERFNPEFSRPAFRVIEVFVLLELNLCVLDDLTNQMPVLMILCFCQNHRLCRNQLSSAWFAFVQCDLHRFDQCFTNMPYDLTARSLLIWIQSKLSQNVLNNLNVLLRLFKIFFPLFFQFVVFRATECSCINLH